MKRQDENDKMQMMVLLQEQQVEKRFVFQSHLVDLHSIPSTYLHLGITKVSKT